VARSALCNGRAICLMIAICASNLQVQIKERGSYTDGVESLFIPVDYKC